MKGLCFCFLEIEEDFQISDGINHQPSNLRGKPEQGLGVADAKPSGCGLSYCSCSGSATDSTVNEDLPPLSFSRF